MESKKREKYIAEWIGRPLKPPLHNEDDENEDKEEDVGAPLASTEDSSLVDRGNKGREDDREDNGIYNCEDTMLYNAEDNEEEDTGYTGP